MTENTTAPHTAPDPITVAAQMMLDNRNAIGSPGYDGELGRRCLSAVIFASEADRAAGYNAAPIALLRAFLQALIDPLHPDLDYLRADPAAGAKAREGRTWDQMPGVSQ